MMTQMHLFMTATDLHQKVSANIRYKLMQPSDSGMWPSFQKWKVKCPGKDHLKWEMIDTEHEHEQ